MLTRRESFLMLVVCYLYYYVTILWHGMRVILYILCLLYYKYVAELVYYPGVCSYSYDGDSFRFRVYHSWVAHVRPKLRTHPPRSDQPVYAEDDQVCQVPLLGACNPSFMYLYSRLPRCIMLGCFCAVAHDTHASLQSCYIWNSLLAVW